MGLWIELMCDYRLGERDGVVHMEPPCRTNAAQSLGMLSASTQRAAINTIHLLEKQARDAGWRRFSIGWACPYCAGELQREKITK